MRTRCEVYTHINMIAPGKNGASTNPRKNLASTNPVKEVAVAWHADITPLAGQTGPNNQEGTYQIAIAPPSSHDGFTRVSSRLDGSCMSRYPTNNILVARLKSVPAIPRSFSNVPSRACERLLQTVSLIFV
jgi:hypothetical protein